MILILTNKDDILTSDVIMWLRKPFIRWNADEGIENMNINISNSNMEYSLWFNGNKLDFDVVQSVWYRRGTISIKKINNNQFIKSIHRESNKLLEHLYSKFDLIKNISSLNDEFIHNKLDTLVLASGLGLKIPNSLITTSKTELIDFKRINGEIINSSFGS